MPEKPIKPNKLKLFAVVLGIAGAIGAGCVFAAEMLDGSIRRSRDLESIVDKHLIVTIPYISAPGEDSRRRRNFILLCTLSVVPLLVAVAGVVLIRVPVDVTELKQFWLHTLAFVSH